MNPTKLTRFAADVLHYAHGPDVIRFGDRKVFICTVAEAMTLGGDFRGSLETFKKRLLEARRAGLLTLARADLVSAMDPELVAWSETPDDIATFHFVVLQ